MSNSMKSLCIILLLLACGRLSAQNQEHRVRNVVLVYDAWADGSGLIQLLVWCDRSQVAFDMQPVRGVSHFGPPAPGSANTAWDIHDDL